MQHEAEHSAATWPVSLNHDRSEINGVVKLSNEYLLEMVNISKSFPGVQALRGVDLRVRYGEVHALVGENGAGKSTIMKCLMGMYKPSSGTILFDGREISNYTTADALNFGISMIHQELAPVPYRSIMENIWLGREPRNKYGLIDHRKMYDMTLEVLQTVGLTEDPKTLMVNLTIARQQLVEITRAVSCNAKLIIMDEPTSALTDTEVAQLFKIIRQLREKNTSVVYISHKLDEIRQIADRVSVFRDGEYIGTEDAGKLPQDKMIQMMVGREVSNLFPKTRCDIGEVVLEVRHLSHPQYFSDVSFTVRRGEILGFAGLVGSGRTEVLETIFGIRKKSGGEILLHGEPINIQSSEEAIAKKMALLTEERRYNGIFPVLDLVFNTAVANMARYTGPFGFVNNRKMREDCLQYIERLQVKTPSERQRIENLSGGNQQKVLVARWLLTQPDIIMLDEPTRGIDVGAKAEIHKLISQLAADGKCVIMVSSELPEIMGMSDRILVMHEGRVTGIVENDQNVTQELLMTYATASQERLSAAQ